jgi:glycosyltransferase involved in cell wall biosynthesis
LQSPSDQIFAPAIETSQTRHWGICAIVPAYNEAEKIAPVLVKLDHQVNWILVVDDGSSDLTSEVAVRCNAEVIRHERNLGKGAALRSGLEWAMKHNFDFLVTIDGDGQHDPNDIPKLLAPLKSGEADVVNGSRISPEMPRHRRMANGFLNFLAKRNSRSKEFVQDSQSGFRAYNMRAIHKLRDFVIDGMGVDSELISLAFRNGLRVKEINVATTYDENTPTHNPVRQAVDIIIAIVSDLSFKNPLRYLAFPGIILMLAGTLCFGALVTDYFTMKHYFSIPFTLLSILTLGPGTVMAVTGILLHAIDHAVKRILLRRK